MTLSRMSVSAACFIAGSVALSQPASAVLSNQFVPVGVIDTGTAVGEDAFGVAYDPVNDVIWHQVGGLSASAFTPFKNLTIGALPIDGVTGLPVLTVSTGATTPLPAGSLGLNALGFDSGSGELVIHDSAGGASLVRFAPITGALGAPIPITPGIAGFIDGLDIEGSDVYFSPEGGSGFRKSFKNGAIFLDDTSVPQTDISSVSVIGTTITRWAGIEAVTALGTVYTVAEVSFGAGRTVATYDLSGSLIAVDPDGSPFASRLEDLAYDGRYLYGGSLGDSRIFVFDIVGPGGTNPIPEPLTAGLSLLSLAGVALAAMRRTA